jgi:hypothetical protein
MNVKSRLGVLERKVVSFAEMAGLPNFEQRKRALLEKCDDAYAIAEVGRNYTDKSGNPHNDPDCSGMVKCIELAARIMGVLAEAEKRAKDGEGETRAADVEQIASLLRSCGYRVEKAA